MSIPNIFDKIKGKIGVDKITILYLFIIVGVGVGSFGLGRFSANNSLNDSEPISIIDNSSIDTSLDKNIDNNKISNLQSDQPQERRYVASKNGKMYYSLGCSGAKRIKKENEVWFSTSLDAEKSGYTRSSTCK
ncbi:MAG: hypothetical protein WCT42_01060 [Candidatus Paceibacterota bacterium]